MILYAYLSGAATLGFIGAGLFFFRFWRRTSDSLFLAFSLAFLLLGLNQALLVLMDVPEEERSWLYMLRLVAFVLILVAIGLKNLRK
jgi:NADH:ubiquinone oxidoreductase subunit 3 (subunit A)